MELIITDLTEELAISIIDCAGRRGRKCIKRWDRRFIIERNIYLYDLVLEGDFIVSAYKNLINYEDMISIKIVVDGEITTIAVLNSSEFRSINII